jgi:hypothetical protein
MTVDGDNFPGLPAHVNYLQNSQFEKNTAGAVTSAGSLTLTSSAIKGKNSLYKAVFNLGETIDVRIKTPTNEWIGKNCEVYGAYVTNSVAGSVTVSVVDVANTVTLLAAQGLPAADSVGTHKRFSYNFPCPNPNNPSGPDLRLRFTAVSGTALIFDDGYVGLATNLGQFMAGGQWVGSINWVPATNCGWTTTSATFVDFPADGDCTTPTVTGALIVPGTKTLTFGINALSGRYLLISSGLFYNGNSGAEVSFRFSDGTVNSGSSTLYTPSASNSTTTVSGSLSVSSPGLKTFSLQGQGNPGTATASIKPNLTIEVYYFPDASLQAIRADQTNWGPTGFGAVPITATITNPTKGTTTTDYITCLRNGASLECNWGLRQTVAGSAGSGTYLVGIPISTGCTIDTTKIPASTTLRIGNVGSAGGIDGGPTRFVYSAYVYDSTRIFLSGTYGLSSPGTSQGHEWSSSFIHFGLSSFEMSGNFKVPCVGWISNQGAPQLVNGVVSPSEGVERFTRARFSNSGSCAVVTQSGSWITSVTDPGTGRCGISTNVFTDKPTCICTDATGSPVRGCRIDDTTLTASFIEVYTDNGTSAADVPFNILCSGPR